jgi:glycosyltransferase involved in cell wall biosynthesis
MVSNLQTNLSRALNRLVPLTGKTLRSASRLVRRDGESQDGLFQYSWYIRQFMSPDATPSQARAHFRKHWREGNVRPNPVFDPTMIASEQSLAESINPVEFAEQNPAALDQVCEWFSRQEYRRRYPDVADSWPGPPELHFLFCGLAERRQPAFNFTVRLSDAANSSPEGGIYRRVDRFDWDGRSYEVVRINISSDIYAQIRDQARFEMALFAPGSEALPNLRKVLATDILSRSGLDLTALTEAIRGRHDVVVFISSLVIGDGYVSDIVSDIRARMGLSVLIVVTESTEQDTRKNEGHPALASLFGSRLLFWRDVVFDRSKDAWLVALLVNQVRPTHVFVVNSNLGYTMLARYGRALASITRCFAMFFNEVPDAIGTAYSARYFMAICLQAHAVVDNESMASMLRSRAAGVIDDRILVLPPKVHAEPESRFEARVSARFIHKTPGWLNRCVCIAGSERFNCIDIVLEIARQLPNLQVDLFGTAPDGMRSLIASQSNLHDRGQFFSLDELDLESYGWLLLPGLLDGLPSAVLEAAQAGLPVIASDVGALRQTFMSEDLFFVTHSSDPIESAARFVEAIAVLQSLDPSALEAHIRSARAAVISHHGPHAYSARVDKLLQTGAPRR